jgi:hypothetical protein
MRTEHRGAAHTEKIAATTPTHTHTVNTNTTNNSKKDKTDADGGEQRKNEKRKRKRANCAQSALTSMNTVVVIRLLPIISNPSFVRRGRHSAAARTMQVCGENRICCCAVTWWYWIFILEPLDILHHVIMHNGAFLFTEPYSVPIRTCMKKLFCRYSSTSVSVSGMVY